MISGRLIPILNEFSELYEPRIPILKEENITDKFYELLKTPQDYDDELEEIVEYLFSALKEYKAIPKIQIIDLIITLIKIIDMQDSYTYQHSKNVSNYSKALAERLNLSAITVRRLYVSGLVHDVGKILIPASILNKTSSLTEEEFKIMKLHVEISEDILKRIPFLDVLLPIVGAHHERINGKGYPKKLKGEEISINARILAIADAFDAMTTSRVYKNKLSFGEAIKEIKNNSGNQFDPYLADEFINMLSEK